MIFFRQREKINYAFVSGFELQYKDIPTKIIVERLYPKVKEYQVICTNGRPLFVHLLDLKLGIDNKLYDLDYNGHLIEDFEDKHKVEEMIEMARELSRDFKLVRVDFMLVNGQYIFFQEFTFTPYSGFADKSVVSFHSKKWKEYIDLNV